MSKFNIIEQLTNLKDVTKELSTRLRSLTFSDNFDSFEVDVTVPAASVGTEEINVRNNLTIIPSRYIILSQEGGGLITRGSRWDINYISFKNASASEDAKIKIMVMR